MYQELLLNPSVLRLPWSSNKPSTSGDLTPPPPQSLPPSLSRTDPFNVIYRQHRRAILFINATLLIPIRPTFLVLPLGLLRSLCTHTSHLRVDSAPLARKDSTSHNLSSGDNNASVVGGSKNNKGGGSTPLVATTYMSLRCTTTIFIFTHKPS